MADTNIAVEYALAELRNMADGPRPKWLVHSLIRAQPFFGLPGLPGTKITIRKPERYYGYGREQ